MSKEEAPYGYTRAGKPRKRPARPGEGKPSSFKPEYCEQLIQYMSGGLSFEAFAGHLGVAVSTIWQWEQEHEKFAEAKKVGYALGLEFWEKLGRNAAAGKVPNFNATVWIFNMKNRYQWRDRHEIQVKKIQPAIVERLDGGTIELTAEEVKE